MKERPLTRRDALAAGLALGSTAWLSTSALGCAAIYPELGTRTSPAPGGPLQPPPPPDLRWLAFESAVVPERTRDGRAWGRVKGGLPDPVARLFVEDVEILKTDAAADTLTPKFTGKRGNFVVPIGALLRVELWDRDPLNDRGIGTRTGRLTEGMVAARQWEATFDMGGSVTLRIEPAHALWGLGFWYELGQGAAKVTRLYAHSPASRAALQKGDAVVKIGPVDVAVMTADEIRSAMNAPPPEGLALTVRRKDGSTLVSKVVPGPIYPTFAEHGILD